MSFRLSILKKFVFAFLLLSMLPLCGFGFFTTHSLWKIGQEAIGSSSAELEKRALEAIELRAIELANRVSQFLRICESDLLTLQMMPRDPQVYQGFSLTHRRTIWTREGTNEQPIEVRKELPLYREIAFIGPEGGEKILIRDDKIESPSELRDVSDSKNTTYLCESYFEETRNLPTGEIYVSHVTGWYVNQDEQLAGANRIEDAIEGKRFEGVVRFAIPCRGADGHFEGMVMLSLDHRHLMEMTQHILPTEERFVLFPSYSSGNYAFMFDDEGWIISHPKFWNIRGILPNGTQFNAKAPSYTQEKVSAGQVPFNLAQVPFVHPNYPLIASEVLAGKSGVTSTFNVGGIPRVMAYAPILYDRGPYTKHGIFGGVTIGVEVAKFHEPAMLTSTRIQEMVNQTKKNAFFALLATALGATALAYILARTFTKPILHLAGKAKDIAAGHIPSKIEVATGDELEILATNFTFMAAEIKQHQESLERSLTELGESKKLLEQHAIELEKRIRILKNINYLSNYLGTVFEREKVLQTVLKTCVEGLDFDRAILYLYDPENRQLVCDQAFGFSAEQETRAKAACYDIVRHDCIPTRVFRTGQTIYVKDIHTDMTATPLDLKIFEIGQTNFFVFTPIIVRDQVIGVLGADNATSKREITEIDVESFQILANDAARAIERSQLYQRVISERNLIESILTNMTTGIISLDQRGVITSVNPYSERVFTVDKNAVINKHFREAFKYFPSWLQLLETFVQSSAQQSRALEHLLHVENGPSKYLEIGLSRIEQNGHSESVILAFIRDITERKRLENHLRRSERLISLGTLAAGIAHEIRNPLTGICLLLDDLHDKLDQNPTEREMIRKALGEIEKLENLVNGLLDLAAPSRRPRLLLRTMDPTINNTLFLIKKQCKNQKIFLESIITEHLPPVKHDPERIRQALLNLFLNAIQAMPDGGTLSLKADQVSAEDSLISEPAFRIQVIDSGKGVSPEDLEYIFDPFFSRNPNGIGLGLSIVHNIIEEHGGSINVTSDTGRGTTFRIDLPLDAPPAQGPVA